MRADQRIAKIVAAAKERVDASGRACVWISAEAGADLVADQVWAELTRKSAPLRHNWRVARWPDGFGCASATDDGGSVDIDSSLPTLALRVKQLHVPTETELRSISACEAHRTIMRAMARIVTGSGLVVISSRVGCTPATQIEVKGAMVLPLYRVIMQDSASAALACMVTSEWSPQDLDALTSATIGDSYVEL